MAHVHRICSRQCHSSCFGLFFPSLAPKMFKCVLRLFVSGNEWYLGLVFQLYACYVSWDMSFNSNRVVRCSDICPYMALIFIRIFTLCKLFVKPTITRQVVSVFTWVMLTRIKKTRLLRIVHMLAWLALYFCCILNIQTGTFTKEQYLSSPPTSGEYKRFYAQIVMSIWRQWTRKAPLRENQVDHGKEC